jgi:hypothetical protein
MTETEDLQFVCTACDASYEGDKSTVMTECKVCNRLHCSDCVDEYGRCVECKDTDSPS